MTRRDDETMRAAAGVLLGAVMGAAFWVAVSIACVAWWLS